MSSNWFVIFSRLFLAPTATDAIYAAISRWMGVTPKSLSKVLPNWSRLENYPQGDGIAGLLGSYPETLTEGGCVPVRFYKRKARVVKKYLKIPV